MTRKTAYNCAAQAVVVRKMIAAHGGNAAIGHGFLPGRNVAVILGVGVLDSAYGGDAHSIKVGACLCRIALEIAVQCAVLLRNGEFVAGPREMVHANVDVAGFEEFQQAGSKDLKLLHTFRKVSGKRALLLFQPRHVRIAKQGNAIGSELEDLVDGVRESPGSLMREAVDKIDVYALKAKGAGNVDEVACQFEWLNAVYGFLHIGVKILNAHTEAVETQAAKRFKMRA